MPHDVDDDTPIWRYMRLGPFLEMCMSNGLFQTRVDALADASEGAYGYKDSEFAIQLPASLGVKPLAVYGATGPSYVQPRKRDVIIAARRHTVVTCWFRHDNNESFGMWRVYGGDEFAVAISTTVGALRAAFSESANVRIASVAYSPMPIHINDAHTLFFHKRKEYIHENEIRSVQVFASPVPERYHLGLLSAEQMDALFATIVAAPGMRPTMFKSLLSLVKAQFASRELSFDDSRLRHSDLDNDLLY